MDTVTIVTTKTETGAVLKNFLSTCTLSPKTLYYNTGNGYATASCINARGNQSFDSSSAGSRPLKDDYYVGTGGPAEAAVSAAVQASELVGRHIGKVEKTYRGVTPDITSDGTNPVVVTSATYTCDGRLFTSENVDKGTISGAGRAPWRDSNGDPITQVITYVTSGFTTATLAVISGPAAARANPKPGWKFDGWYVNGTKVTATSSASNIYVSPSNPNVLNVRADYRQDVSAEARFVVDPSLFFRWTATMAFTEGGAESTNTYRLAAGTEGTALWNFSYSEHATTKLSDMYISPIKRWKKNDVLYADYLPYDWGGWTGRAIGAKRVGKILVGWELHRGNPDGVELGDMLPPDSSTTVAEIIGRFLDADIPFSSNSNYANYWVAHLVAAWGEVSTGYEEETTGCLDGQTPQVEYTSEATSGGAKVTATAQTEGLTGVVFKQWRATGVTLDDATDPTAEFIMPEGSVSLVAVYGLKTVTASHGIDAASAGAVVSGQGTSVTDSEGQAVTTIHFNDTVVFHAPSPLTGYSFSGWYVNGADTPASTALNYQMTLDGDVSVVAKYATTVTVSKYEDGGTGEVSIDGTPAPSGSISMEVVRELGATVEISAEAATGYFGGWKIDGSSAVSSLTPTATVAVDGPHEYEAQFLASVTVFTVTCQSEKADEEEEGAAGTLSLAAAEGVTDNGDGTFDVSGFRSVTIQTTPAATTPLPLRGVWTVETVEGESVETPVDITKPFAVSKDVTLLARWGAKTSFTVSVETEDENEGIAFLGDTAGTQSVTVESGATVTATANPSDGFSFAGWFKLIGQDTWSDAPVSLSTKYTFTVLAAATLQARFAVATAAICVWEGSDENKTMEWTSKVYTLPKPFDPVAARVDATGYPVDLIVRTYSSPDKSNPLPVRDHELTSQNPLAVQSQDGRRLPRMRPERFMRVSVESTHEVDAIVVGTNMAEVN